MENPPKKENPNCRTAGRSKKELRIRRSEKERKSGEWRVEIRRAEKERKKERKKEGKKEWRMEIVGVSKRAYYIFHHMG